jgi:hypothetical protein
MGHQKDVIGTALPVSNCRKVLQLMVAATDLKYLISPLAFLKITAYNFITDRYHFFFNARLAAYVS